ncbi:MAG: AAA family ATPase [Pseudomonadales bacterium]|nr:AAA family ATPase [Pseudomonadales bacterium]
MTVQPWLQTAFDRVVTSFQQDQLPHALVIHALPGWGETHLASTIARYFLADKSAHTPLEQIAHPDFHWLCPEAPGKQIKVEQIRSLRNFTCQTKQVAERKVAVIVDAHMMNESASNALLKTLEEPPGDCLLILATNTYHELLPTIRSRCQSLPIYPVCSDANTVWIKENLDLVGVDNIALAPEILELLLFEFGQAPVLVLAALERGDTSILADLILVSKQSGEISRLVSIWAKQELDIILMRWMRYVNLILRMTHSRDVPSELVGPLQPLIAVLGELSSKDLFKFWEELLWARQLVHSTSNINQNMLLERLLLHWSDLLGGE